MLFSGKSHGKLILVLEIQSSLVRGSIAWINNSQPPHLLYSQSSSIAFKKDVDTSYFIKMTQKALREVIEGSNLWLHAPHLSNIPENAPKKITEVHYVLSSPWVASQARAVSVEYKEKTRITTAEIDRILSGERASVTETPDQGLEPIEEKIFDVKLNGYSVNKWSDQEALHIEVSYALSVCSKDTIRRLRESCEHIAHGKNVYFHSSLLLQYICLRSVVMPSRDNYTLIHVHGELTDAVVIERGSCVFFGSYPMGVNTIIRKVAQSTSTDVRAADSLMALYLANKLDEPTQLRIREVMTNLSHGWSAEFSKLFKGTSLAKALPQSAYISARFHEEFFLHAFRELEPSAHVELLEMNQIESNVVLNKISGNPRLVSMYILAINTLN